MSTKQKSYYAKPSEIERKWVVIDAKDLVLGRLASKAAILLSGKHKPTYTPSMDVGDFVIVINASKVKVTGRKLDQKIYYNHSLYPGGLKETSLKAMLSKDPTQVIERAIKGMLPHNRIGRQMFRKLKVYAESNHPHEAQTPELVSI